MNTPIRIVLADDHEIFRDGFNVMLKKQDDIRLVGEAANGMELIQVTEKLLPDIIITDIKMPGIDGIEATKILSKRFPQVNIIALSMFDDDNLIIDMLEAGAKGYLLKSSHKNEIIDAIKAVYKHDTYYCKSTSTKLVHMIAQSRFDPSKEVQKPQFSAKEIEVIRLICQEASNKEMASKLFLSIRTIEGYREKIQEKIKAKNSAGIVVYAIKTGIYKI
jgi:two-component system, NarL family, response regulator NreC